MNITQLFEQAKKDLISHGEHRPTLSIESIEGVTTLEFAQFDLETSFERMIEFFAHGRAYGRRYPHAELRQLALVIEVWMSRNQKCDCPVDDPEREEHLGIWVYDIDGRYISQRGMLAQIIRPGGTLDLLESKKWQVGSNRLLYAFLGGVASKGMTDARFEQYTENFMAARQ